jgi:hypothetical protein
MSGQFRVGDELLAVNGIRATDVPFTTVMQLLGSQSVRYVL